MSETYFGLKNLPERSVKPRNSGLSMVMDKGLALREVEDFLEVAEPYTDIVKLGFGTGILTPKLEEKLSLYKQAGIPVYFGGTLFEAFLIRNQIDDYRRLLEKTGVNHVEISDGSLAITSR